MSQTKNSASILSKLQIPFLLFLVFGGGIYLGTQIPMPPKFILQNDGELTEQESYHEVGKLEELIRLIDARYVDEVDREKMTKQAIDQILLERAKEKVEEPSPVEEE